MFYRVLNVGGVWFFFGWCSSVFTLGCLLCSLLLCNVIMFKLNVSGKENLLRIWTYLFGGPVSCFSHTWTLSGIKGPK